MREATAIAREVANEKGLQGEPASIQALAMDYGRLAILRGHGRQRPGQPPNVTSEQDRLDAGVDLRRNASGSPKELPRNRADLARQDLAEDLDGAGVALVPPRPSRFGRCRRRGNIEYSPGIEVGQQLFDGLVGRLVPDDDSVAVDLGRAYLADYRWRAFHATTGHVAAQVGCAELGDGRLLGSVHRLAGRIDLRRDALGHGDQFSSSL